MREKQWIDCPICGNKNSMEKRSGISKSFALAGYPRTGKVTGLDGQFCAKCGEGFWSVASERKIARHVAEHRARHDAARVVAADLASVRETAKLLLVSAQGVHKMMEEGRLRSVLVADKRLPIRADVMQKVRERKRLARKAS